VKQGKRIERDGQNGRKSEIENELAIFLRFVIGLAMKGLQHQLAAIDFDGFADDVGGSIGGEEGNRSCDFFGGADAA